MSIISIYEDVLNGKRIQFPLYTWCTPKESKQSLIYLLRYLVIDKFKWNRKDFCHKFCLKIIKEYKLNTGFLKVYNRNIYPLVTDAFPEWNIKAWEMESSRVPAGFWTEETAIQATKWLIEERLKWDMDRISKHISNSAFFDNNLGGLIRTLNTNAASLVEISYPEYDWSYLKERQGYKITPNQAKEILELYTEGMSQRQIALKYECEPVTVFNIVHGNCFVKRVN